MWPSVSPLLIRGLANNFQGCHVTTTKAIGIDPDAKEVMLILHNVIATMLLFTVSLSFLTWLQFCLS